MNIELEDKIWIRYHDNRAYSGHVKSIEKNKKEGTVITIFTQERGYLSVPISECGFSKPQKRSKT